VAMRVINDVTLLYTTHTELAKGFAILFVVLVLKRGILDWLTDWHRALRKSPSTKERRHASP